MSSIHKKNLVSENGCKILITSNKQSLFKHYGTWMTTFSTNPYLILSNVSSVTLHSFSRNKNQFFNSILKNVVTYMNITITNISNNIIKQYYDIIKKLKVLVIAKKK